MHQQSKKKKVISNACYLVSPKYLINYRMDLEIVTWFPEDEAYRLW